MLNILEINDFSAPELDIYARRTEAQLINKDNPEAGLFIAESPKVIGRALDAGYIPVSALVEKHQMKENEETRQILERFEGTDVPIFTAEFEVLTKNDRIQIDKRNAVRPKASAAYRLSEYV